MTRWCHHVKKWSDAVASTTTQSESPFGTRSAGSPTPSRWKRAPAEAAGLPGIRRRTASLNAETPPDIEITPRVIGEAVNVQRSAVSEGPADSGLRIRKTCRSLKERGGGCPRDAWAVHSAGRSIRDGISIRLSRRLRLIHRRFTCVNESSELYCRGQYHNGGLAEPSGGLSPARSPFGTRQSI